MPITRSVTIEITDEGKNRGLAFVTRRYNEQQKAALPEAERDAYVNITPEAYFTLRANNVLESWSKEEAEDFRRRGLDAYDALPPAEKTGIQEYLGVTRDE